MKKKELKEQIDFLSERISALENVKIKKMQMDIADLDKSLVNLRECEVKDSNELNAIVEKVNILMDRTKTVYSSTTSYESAMEVYNLCRNRGATKEELCMLRSILNKYFFRCQMLKETTEYDETVKPS